MEKFINTQFKKFTFSNTSNILQTRHLDILQKYTHTHTTVYKCEIKTAGYGKIHQYTI